ncbi:hypothetical protein B9Z55_028069 [Caenorhabditis nigoni]|uniref:Uncharacterized protein n=1 Tax=Caenorhabditis nigoni TaxID=1611254 RepID=A0A2G5SD27_9PELO|nr:hypothetical protein B9Z55_028069 [Caenorhabditis nigoni]
MAPPLWYVRIQQKVDFEKALNEGGERALRLREKVFKDMRALDVELGRNFRNGLREIIGQRRFDLPSGITPYLPPGMISYLNDVSVEKLIEFICTRNEEVWANKVLADLFHCFFTAKEFIDHRNNFILAYHPWDIDDYEKCYKYILKDALYLYAKHGRMFVHALAEFMMQRSLDFFTDHPDAEGLRARVDCLGDYRSRSRDEEKNPYDFENLFYHCLGRILVYQRSDYCGYALAVFAPWLAGAKEALNNSRADFRFYDRKYMKKQQEMRLAKYKIEKNEENDLYVLKKVVPEERKNSKELDGVKNEISKERAKKRKLDINVIKTKHPVVTHTTKEVSDLFHRFTPFPSKGGFANCEYSQIKKNNIPTFV